MWKYIRNAIEKHALKDYPRECCGLVIAVRNKQKYIPCRNVAENDTDFKLPAEDYAEAEDQGQVLAVIHSHIDRTASATEVDKISCEATGLPWHIVAVGKDAGEEKPAVKDWFSFEPTGYESPLVGREFFHGSLDCYGLIRDFYQREMNIELIDFERPDYWWNTGDIGELYLDNFKKAGFEIVKGDLEFGDVVLMQYRSEMTNHGGVFIGDNQLKSQPELHAIPGALLHHPMPRLSERVIYQGYWKDITRVVVRYVNNAN